MTKLSFIVPVYNVAPYLRKCVDSLIAQDYTDYEIILVDDGSTDNSGAICDEYASRSSSHPLPLSSSHPSIRTIHQDNAGLSAARNAGIMEARGTYLCFVDSDDYWQPNVLGTMMARIERDKLDVLRFDYQNVRLSENNRYEVCLPNKYPHPVDTHVGVVTGEQYLNERMFYTCYAVMYIFRRDLIVPNDQSPMVNDKCEKNNVLFTPGIHFEDVDWFPRMMLRAKRVNSTSTIVYNYLIRQGSITQVHGDKLKIRKNLEDNYYVLNTLISLEQQYPNCIWLCRMASMIASGMLVNVATYFYDERKEHIRRLRLQHVFPLLIADQGKTYRRRAKLINLLGPSLYCTLMHLRK